MDSNSMEAPVTGSRSEKGFWIRWGVLSTLLAMMYLTGCSAPPARDAQSLAGPISLNLASAWGSQVPTLGELPMRFADEVAKRSNQQFRFRFYEPGELTPPDKMLDAVGSGKADAGYYSSGYSVTHGSEFALFAGFPFSPGMKGHWKWMQDGGGSAAMVALYRPHNVMPLACGYTGTEGFGWFRKQLAGPEDLRGMKMRFFGLGARVMQKLGVRTQLLASGDIFPALQKGS